MTQHLWGKCLDCWGWGAVLGQPEEPGLYPGLEVHERIQGNAMWQVDLKSYVF